MPPYQFMEEHLVIPEDGEMRPPNADERERLHAYPRGHTRGFSEPRRVSFFGNGFHCIVVAILLGSWAVNAGYLAAAPTLAELWERAGRGGTESRGGLTQEASCITAGPLWGNPGIHVSEEQDRFNAIDQIMDDPYCLGDNREAEGDTCYHLIQDEAVISDLQQNVLPPDE